jgi:hypothetical protein
VIDLTIHLGDVIVSGTGVVVVWSVRHLVSMVKSATGLIEEIHDSRDRLDRIEPIVDVHSDALTKSGWVKFPMNKLAKTRK